MTLKESEMQVQEIEIKNVMIKVAGKPFRCKCGCNVFHHPEERPEVYECNACEQWYEGDDRDR